MARLITLTIRVSRVIALNQINIRVITPPCLIHSLRSFPLSIAMMAVTLGSALDPFANPEAQVHRDRSGKCMVVDPLDLMSGAFRRNNPGLGNATILDYLAVTASNFDYLAATVLLCAPLFVNANGVGQPHECIWFWENYERPTH